MTLYELQSQFAALYEMAANGDIDDKTFEDTLEAMSFDEEFEAKAEGYAKVIRSLTGDMEMAKAEIDRLQNRKNSLEQSIKQIKNRLQEAMAATGREKIKTPLFSIYLQKNAPRLVLDQEAEIPAEYLIPQPPKVDGAAIKEKLMAGESLPFAALEQGTSLRIR